MPIRRTCTFCGREMEPGTGKMFIKRDGTIFLFCSSKCQKNQLVLRRVGRRVRWTARYVKAAPARVQAEVVARELAVTVGTEEVAEEVVAEAPVAEEVEEALEEEAPVKKVPEKAPKEVDPLEEFQKIPGVGKSAAKALLRAGFKSIDDLKKATKEQLEAVKGLDPGAVDRIIEYRGRLVE